MTNLGSLQKSGSFGTPKLRILTSFDPFFLRKYWHAIVLGTAITWLTLSQNLAIIWAMAHQHLWFLLRLNYFHGNFFARKTSKFVIFSHVRSACICLYTHQCQVSPFGVPTSGHTVWYKILPQKILSFLSKIPNLLVIENNLQRGSLKLREI